jgi:hypothetical protein
MGVIYGTSRAFGTGRAMEQDGLWNKTDCGTVLDRHMLQIWDVICAKYLRTIPKVLNLGLDEGRNKVPVTGTRSRRM